MGFLNQYEKYVVFDEVQRVPGLFSYIQTRVDESRIMGQYILSGSQNFQLLKSITQSLAGRVAMFKLMPLDFTELHSKKLLADDYMTAAIKGTYPANFDRDIAPSIFYANYIQTYVERDVAELLNVRFRLNNIITPDQAYDILLRKHHQGNARIILPDIHLLFTQ